MATLIPIANASFELPAQGLGGFTTSSITDWTVTGTTGVFHPFASQLPTPSDGLQVGYSNGGTASQILAATLTAGTAYNLQVDFTARKDCCPFMGTRIDFMAGAIILASNTLSTLAPGAAQTLSVTYNAFAGDPLLGQALQIRIGTTTIISGQIDFDNVRLDGGPIVAGGVPEPGTLILTGGGIMLALAARRRRS